MTWWRTEDSEIERQRLQAWQQLRFAYAIRAAPARPWNFIVDTFDVWFWKWAVRDTERKALKRRIRAVKTEP